MAKKDDLGRRGEELAARYLTGCGYRILDRNWRCGEGELDIIAARGDEIAVVEVKTRSGTAFGHPLEAITAAKSARLRRLAARWAEEVPHPHALVRIDAIAVLAPPHVPDAEVLIEHLRGVC